MDRDAASLTLRPARLADAREIKSLVRQARLNPFGLDWRRFTVLENRRGHVVGCVQLKPHGSGTRELASLVVASDWRGQGLGARLVRHAQDGAGPPLWLMCAPELERFYRQFDFRRPDTASSMAPYFRRIHRFSRVVRGIWKRAPLPVIMLWDDDSPRSAQ